MLCQIVVFYAQIALLNLSCRRTFAATYMLPIVPLQSRVGIQILFKSPQVDKFLDSFRWRKSATFLGATVRK
jgi:hypothetical protein